MRREEYEQNEEQLDRQNEIVENYMTLEFVAIPPDFDIMNHLSLREQGGIFESTHVNLKHLNIIADGVKSSPVFAMLNNIRIHPATCLYFLKVIHELELVLKTLYNPMRDHIDRFIAHFDNYASSPYIKGQRVGTTINFVIVNMFPMMNDDVINESMEIAMKLQSYQTGMDEKIKSMNNIL